MDFLYPLFLIPSDRVMWYDECEARISHMCQYKPEDDGDLLEMNLDICVPDDISRESDDSDLYELLNVPVAENTLKRLC